MKGGTETIIVSNDKKDLFRVHFYETCIKFDLKFAEGISKNAFVCKKVIEINQEWSEKKISLEDVLSRLVILIELNADKFQDYYFQDYELNKSGKYVDLVPLDSLMIELSDKAHNFYQYLLKEEVLTEIDKKEFESNIKHDIYKDMYVDLYSSIFKRKRLKFYQYRLNENFGRKTCNIIATKKQVLFGYTF